MFYINVNFGHIKFLESLGIEKKKIDSSLFEPEGPKAKKKKKQVNN